MTLPSFGREFQGTDRYHLVRTIGTGGFGSVYEAIDVARGDHVALKLLRRGDGGSIDQFKAEFRALAQTWHPNLVSLYELASADSRWFYTMELLEGVDILRSLGRAPQGDAVRRRFLQLARAVSAIHATGRLHGDLKPSNVLVTTEGRVVVLDLAMACATGAGVFARVVGTADYMAPEHARGEPCPASDWFSFGVMLREALAACSRSHGSATPAVEEPLHDLAARLLHTNPSERLKGDEILQLLAAPEETKAKPWHPPGSPVFVGRVAEMRTLLDALSSTVGGATTIVRVSGPSGVGKSALLARFAHVASRRSDVLVLAARCYDRESIPFKAMDAILDVLAARLRTQASRAALNSPIEHIGALVQMFPGIADVVAVPVKTGDHSVGAQEQRERAFAALRELFATLAQDVHVVVLLDDAQWADAESLRPLRELLAGRPPIQLVVAYRTEGVLASNFLAALAIVADRIGEGVSDVRLGPLPHDDALELARSMLPASSENVVAAVVREASANPFLMTQIAEHIADRSRPGAPVLGEVLEARLVGLPQDARDVLEGIAVSGNPLAEEVLVRVTNAQGALSEALSRLHRKRLIWRSPVGNGLVVYHDRIREAVVAQMPLDRRRWMHRRLAEALSLVAPREQAAIAEHLERAGDRVAAAKHALSAAQQARRLLAFKRASDLYARAFSLDPGCATPHRLAEMGAALANAGRPVDSAAAYLDAAAKGDGEQYVAWKRMGSEQLLIAGRIEEGLGPLGEALSHDHIQLPRVTPASLASLLLVRAANRWTGLRALPGVADRASAARKFDAGAAAARGLASVDPVRAAILQTRCVRWALDAEDPSRIAAALCTEIVFTAAGGARTRSQTKVLLARFERAVAAAENAYAWGLRTFVHAFVALAADFRLRTAVELFDRSVRELREAPARTWEMGDDHRDRLRTDLAQLYSLEALVRMGDLPELDRRSQKMLRSARERGHRVLEASLIVGAPHLAWLARGDPERLRARVRGVMEAWSNEGFHIQRLWEMRTLAHADLYEGRPADALRRFERVRPRLARSGFLNSAVLRTEALHFHANLLVATARDAHPSHRRRLLHKAARIAVMLRRADSPHARPLASLVQASIERMHGNLEVSRRLLADAELLFDTLDMELYATVARWHRGHIHAADADVQKAARSFAQLGVVAPARLANVLAAGFDDTTTTSNSVRAKATCGDPPGER